MVLQPLCPPTPQILQVYPKVVRSQRLLSGEQGRDWATNGTHIGMRTRISGVPRGSTKCDYPTLEGTLSRQTGILCRSRKGVV